MAHQSDALERKALTTDEQAICDKILAAFPQFSHCETGANFRCAVHHGAALVMSSLCRDEISIDATDPDNTCRHVLQCAKGQGGVAEVFEFGSLGGLCNVGETGYVAATHHVPPTAGAKVVLVGGPHIGHVISPQHPDGGWGLVYRAGFGTEEGGACGAVINAVDALRERAAKLPGAVSQPFAATAKALLAPVDRKSDAAVNEAVNPPAVPSVSAAPIYHANGALPAFNDYEQNDLVRSVEQQFLAAAMLGATGMTEFRTAVAAFDKHHPSSQLMVAVTNCVRAACEQRLEFVAHRVQDLLNERPDHRRTIRVIDCLVVHWCDQQPAKAQAAKPAGSADAGSGGGKPPSAPAPTPRTRTFVAYKQRDFKKQEAKDGGKAHTSPLKRPHEMATGGSAGTTAAAGTAPAAPADADAATNKKAKLGPSAAAAPGSKP